MATIKSDDWSKFVSRVAKARAAGRDVTIVTGPAANGQFVAEVGPANSNEEDTPAGDTDPKESDA